MDYEEERARLDAADQTRACPYCGQEVWNSCYHEGIDVRAVVMRKQDQISLRTKNTISILQCDGWIAVYDKGEKVFENHSCGLKEGLEALEINFIYHDLFDAVDEDGNFPNGDFAFPDRLPCTS